MKHGRIDLSDVYDVAVEIQQERHEKKKFSRTTNILSENYGLVGLLGEFTFSKAVGLPVNTELLLGGDGGADFAGAIDVKSTEEYKLKYLIEYMHKKEYSHIYVLTSVNLQQQYGMIHGWITGDDFISNASVVNFGYGDRYTFPYEYLNDAGPLIEYVKEKQYEKQS